MDAHPLQLQLPRAQLRDAAAERQAPTRRRLIRLCPS